MGRKRSAKNRSFPPNLYQNSAGYFFFINPANKKSKGLGTDKAKAFTEARAANAVLATMKKTALADWVSGKQDYSLTDWVPLYKELWIAKTDPAEKTTLRNATGYLNRIASADFAWMKLTQINTAQIAKFIAEIEKESGSATAKNLRARLSDVFRYAENQGLIDSGKNPVTSTYTPTRKVLRERLSIEQFFAIRNHAATWVQRAMDLALLTGQRREDICNMKFADSKDGYLFIVQGKSGGEMRLQQDLKIRLDALNMTIGDAVQNCRDMIISRHMIHQISHWGASKPGKQISPNGLSNAFQAARDAAGIVATEGRTPPSFHEIRSLSERLYREQYGKEFAQAMLGHKNEKMTNEYDDMRGKGYQVISAKSQK